MKKLKQLFEISIFIIFIIINGEIKGQCSAKAGEDKRITCGGSTRLQVISDLEDEALLQINMPIFSHFKIGFAEFGKNYYAEKFIGELKYIMDKDSLFTGCGEASYPIDTLKNYIALIDRGGCNFSLKAYRAQTAGAIGVIIVNNKAGNIIENMSAGDSSSAITIPVIMISQENGDSLKNFIKRKDTVRVCFGYTDLNYSWTPAESLDDPTSAEPIASPKVTTEYKVIITHNRMYCFSADSLTVYVNPLIADAGTDIEVDSNSIVQLQASSNNYWKRLRVEDKDSLTSIIFTDSLNGIAAGENGVILKTIDGGEKWSKINSGTNQILNSIAFTSKDTGYIAGSNTILLKTIDGGEKWKNQTTTNFIWNSISFPVKDTGYAAGYAGAIIKTTDGGIKWENPTNQSSGDLFSIFFITTQRGWAGGAAGKIIKTTDGGINWTEQQSGISYTIKSLYFTDSLNGYACGEWGSILKTEDGGRHWKQSASPVNNHLNRIHFINKKIGYAAGAKGTILKTTDSGKQWIEQESGTDKTISKIFFTDGKRGYAAGAQGTILKFTDENVYEWFPTDGLNNPHIENPVLSPLATSEYIVKITNSAGCSDTDTIRITVKAVSLPGKISKPADFAISPIPAAKEIKLSLPDLSCQYELAVYDINNQLMNKTNILPGIKKPSLNIEKLKPGVYFLKLTEKNNIYIKKFVKL
ncbi:MAG: T9SS type A sorting domain-containing protein [Bacteroidales bacterium]|nr:T9SS type A sorting domain-containing protein [Bacteroidales bacterium]